jgi:hypothetical protein
MNRIISLLIIIAFIGCKKENVIDNSACNNMATIDNWLTISFKTNYTIQVPPDYKGLGMGGFEGNTFSKFSNDTTIVLDYGYCNGLFCNDFGDTLQSTIPLSISVRDNSNNLITLDKMQKFCQNTEITGILYYTNNNISSNKLYWNSRLYLLDYGLFKQAMQIRFPAKELETVNEIIGTIKPFIR